MIYQFPQRKLFVLTVASANHDRKKIFFKTCFSRNEAEKLKNFNISVKNLIMMLFY